VFSFSCSFAELFLGRGGQNVSVFCLITPRYAQHSFVLGVVVNVAMWLGGPMCSSNARSEVLNYMGMLFGTSKSSLQMELQLEAVFVGAGRNVRL